MANITYVTVGTNDKERAKQFYDELFADTFYEPSFDHPRGRIYSNGPTLFGLLEPFDGKPATAGNGSMFGFSFDSPENVDAFYKKAMELGATDEGAPGERIPESYFCYFRDLDGNKLCAYCLTKRPQKD